MAKVEYIFDPFERVKLETGKERAQAKRELKQAIINAIIVDAESGKSSVTGKNWKKLSKEYADAQKGGNRLSDMTLRGDLLDSLFVKNEKGGLLKVSFSDKQQGKADGHNNFSGKSRLPSRKTIPNADKNEVFRPAIRDVIDDIIRGVKDDST